MPHANGEGHRGRPLVLIVDSNVATVEQMAVTVRSKGYSVLTAMTFEEGKALWRTQAPDVLVVDIRLGQYNGLQLLIRARADNPDVTAVVTSPTPDPVLEAEAMRCGGTFLIKPVSSRQLLNAIDSASSPKGEVLPMDRRKTERRQMIAAEFMPERRVADRRIATPADAPSGSQRVYDRRSGRDRRQEVIPGYQPERRQGPRRSS